MLPTNPLLHATAPAGPHLPVALLRQYAAGALAPAAQHRVEAHTLGCPRCADILEGLLQTPPATTDQAVAQLQQRLRQRMQQVAAPSRQSLRLAPRPRWLSLQLAAAATLLLSLVAGGWWAWQQRRPAPATAAVASGPSPAEPAPMASKPLAGQRFATARVRMSPLPTPGSQAPTPLGGLASFREKLRREATEFKPAAPEQPLSGTVQLRLTIGADGKIQQTKVLRGLRADYDAEAQRLACDGPGWISGISSGKHAPLEVDIAVPF